MEYGVVDPLKVTTNALIDAGSVAGMMITTESVVVDVPTPYTGPPEVETGERADPAKHKVPEDWSYERELENQWRKTEKAVADGDQDFMDGMDLNEIEQVQRIMTAEVENNGEVDYDEDDQYN